MGLVGKAFGRVRIPEELKRMIEMNKEKRQKTDSNTCKKTEKNDRINQKEAQFLRVDTDKAPAF